jgi:thiol-disulfide isomerase/thioredoxin
MDKMKQIIVLLVLLLTLNHYSAAQDSIRISGNLKGNTRFAKVVLKRFGIGVFDITSVPITHEQFSLSIPADIAPGVYRLQYGQSNSNEYLDVIINGKEKEISFVLDLSSGRRIPVFNWSSENIKWHDYLQKAGGRITKIELLHQLLAQYPDTTDALYRTVVKAANRKKRDYTQSCQQFVTQNRNSWAGAMVVNTPYYFTRPRDLPQLQDYNRKQNYWSGINTADATLIATPLYIELIQGYLKYHRSPEMSFSEQEMNDSFKKSVDTIMHKFGGNAQTQKFALKFLQLGFMEVGNEKILQYIDEKYQGLVEQCDDNAGDKEALQRRLTGYKVMKPGMQAPEINLSIHNGSFCGLKTMPQQKLIVVFWASWCSYCEREMPKLEAFLKKHADFGAVGVSLDEDSQAYQKAIQQYPSLTHTCDFKKWKSKPVMDYYITGSPTFILLDSERKIVGKYPSFDALLEENK